MAGATLDAKGWHLSTEGIEQCVGENSRKDEKIIEIAKDTDFKEIGRKWLPDDVNKVSCEYVEGPGVLQIQKIRNVAAPKDNEESQGAPRLLKLTLTDGHLNSNGVETEKLDKFGMNIPPGTKVLLKGTVAVEHGIMLLNNKNCQLIGGRVEKMAENWELKKMLSKQSKLRGVTEGGPPPFVPFGHRIQEVKPATQKDNFKSLATKKEEKKEEGEFEQQRQATIAEALQAKEEKTKTFGGGQKQIGSDKDVARIMEMGFSADQASNSLKQNNGNFQLAVNDLLQGRGGARQNQYGGDRQGQSTRGGRDFQGRQPREDRRENRGRRQKDEDSEELSSKPSAPVTLFDFLAKSNKIPVQSKENKENKDSKSSNSVPSKSMQYSNDGSRQGDRGYKPKYQDNSSNYDRQNSQNDRRNFDSRPKSSPANNPQQSSNFDNKSQRPGSGYDRSKQQDKYDRGQSGYDRNKQQDKYDRGQSGNDRNKQQDKFDRGQRSQQTNNDRNFQQSKGDGQFSNNRQNYNNDKITRNDRSQNYDKRSEQGSNTSDRNFQDSRRPNQKGYDREQNYDRRSDSSKSRNLNDRGYQNENRSSNGNSYESRDSQKRNPGDYSSSRTEQRDSNYTTSNKRDEQNIKSQTNYKGKSENSNQSYQGQTNDFKSRKKEPINNGQQQYQATAGETKTWKEGEHCLAKYWEDNQYYHAVIHQCIQNFAVVLFLEYGNHEEVKLTDIKPLTKVPAVPLPDFSMPPPGMFTYNVPPPANQPTTASQIQSMEFRRKKPDNDKPTMQYYQPPKQRYN
ncbi:tudor domain-containing protein 3-like [Mytilus californianus]|uniref:tudor domain-containing protein 3-like n=1 Tax=Mytilus californianus TaxID=6549 RepID=UPI0022483674|nr:tudor domain-containing protein 3-like [Mytilus californianus]